MDCLNYLFLIGRAALEESVHQFRGCLCFSVCDTFPRSTCILWGLEHLLMKERELKCNSARQDCAFSGAICNFRVWKEEGNVVSLTGESLSGAGISLSNLAGAASRMGLMELTARLDNLSAVQVAGSRSLGHKVYQPLQLGKLG